MGQSAVRVSYNPSYPPLVTVRVSYTPSYPTLVTMTAFWRAAGLNYVHYSAIAARTARAALKPKLQESAAKREIKTIKFQTWENGKPVGEESLVKRLQLLICSKFKH